MREDDSVTVIIPACNAAHSLRGCLESVLAQERLPDQIVIINDGSTDDTLTVARHYLQFVELIDQENRGQGAARNAGLSVARGRFITFLDADDYWLPGFLRRCIGFLQQHPEVIAVNTGLITRLQNGTELIQPPLLNKPDAPTKPLVIDDFFAFWAEHDHIRTGSAVIRKSVIDHAGGQRADLRISQDLEYWGYIATFGRWGYIPEPLWVGNSRAVAQVQGWLAKHRKRRKLCPDVEEWESRIVPRLSPADRTGFEIVRGRVAMGYAQNKILGGRCGSAYHITRKYGSTMPRCTMSKVLRLGCRGGRIGWAVACGVICFREWSKAIRLSIGNWL